MQCRPAGYLDAEALIGLDPAAPQDRQRVNFIHQAVTSRTCHVALLDKKVVGYGVVESTFFGHGFISMLYVDPAFRRQGVGTELLWHMETISKSEKLFAMAHETSPDLKAFLEARNYRPSGTIENLSDDGAEQLYFRRTRSLDPLDRRR